MELGLYDIVKLKDGREAIIIEKFDDTHFMADASTKADEWGIIDIELSDIEKVIAKAKS